MFQERFAVRLFFLLVMGVMPVAIGAVSAGLRHGDLVAGQQDARMLFEKPGVYQRFFGQRRPNPTVTVNPRHFWMAEVPCWRCAGCVAWRLYREGVAASMPHDGHDHGDNHFSETELRVKALQTLLIDKGLVDRPRLTR